jgi:periplasmic protein TonB
VALHLFSSARDFQALPQRERLSGAAVCSIAAHAVVLALLIWVTYSRAQKTSPVPDDTTAARIVWVAMPGPSGGGGGSKAITPPPPKLTPPKATRSLEKPAPAAVPTEATPQPPAPVEPQPDTTAVADTASSGAASTTASAPGNGTGNGAGPGKGDGAGPGEEKGFGGGPYRPGNGVTSPIPTYRATPAYTAEAVRAKAQGIITVECIVEPNGECGDVRIVRGFAPPYGLDQQALATARRWRFRPGTREGEAVPVLVNLEIEFNIR